MHSIELSLFLTVKGDRKKTGKTESDIISNQEKAKCFIFFGKLEQSKELIPKRKQRRLLKKITLQGAIEKSKILLIAILQNDRLIV